MCEADTIYGTISGAIPGVKVDIVAVSCGSESVYDNVRTNSEEYFAFGSVPQGIYLVLPKSLYVDFDIGYVLIQIPQTEIQSYNFTATTKNNH